MPDNLKPRVLLVGAGSMAMEYAKVLLAQDTPFAVVGRGEPRAKEFETKIGNKVITGGIDKYLSRADITLCDAIVAVGVDNLAPIATSLLKAGCKKILLEKPGGLYDEEIVQIADEAKRTQSLVYVAYNRRFFSSTKAAQQIIQNDGGVVSFLFEFTEWSHEIEKLPTSQQIKDKWLLANSSHVIDLAFYLGGWPKTIHSLVNGSLSWHKSGAAFVGAGKTKDNVPFSYHANWDAPGRWGVEILTRDNRLIFRPLEKLQVQKRGTVAITQVEIDDHLDIQFKPGLYSEVIEFLSNNSQSLLTIEEQKNHLKIYDVIIKGRSLC